MDTHEQLGRTTWPHPRPTEPGLEVGPRGLERVLAAIAQQPHASLGDRLCGAAATLLAAPGVTISLNGDGHYQTLAGTPRGAVGDQVQIDLGEGPGHEAHRAGHPVVVTDLCADGLWPAFSTAAVAAGILAAFAFPLRSGAVRVGCLNVYREATGPLTDEQHRDAMVLAAIALELLVSLQSEAPQGPDPQLFADAGRDTWAVHQASGMVSVQMGVALADARALLRARAYTEERSLIEVAEDVVARRIRFDDRGD